MILLYIVDMSNPEKALPRLRPRINTRIPLEPAEVERRIRAHLQAAGSPVEGHFSHGFGRMQLRDDQRYWSPEITLRIEAEKGGSRISGHMGPKAEVWTLFVFCYAVLGLGTLIVLLIGLSNWSLDQSTHILWGVPIGLALFSTIYYVAWTGQRWSRHQMRSLLNFCESAIGSPLQ